MVPHCPATKHSLWLMAIPNHILVINVTCHIRYENRESNFCGFCIMLWAVILLKGAPHFRNTQGFFSCSFLHSKTKGDANFCPQIRILFLIILTSWYPDEILTTYIYTSVKGVSGQTDWNQIAVLQITMQITSLYSNMSSVPTPFWLFLSCIERWQFKFKRCQYIKFSVFWLKLLRCLTWISKRHVQFPHTLCNSHGTGAFQLSLD